MAWPLAFLAASLVVACAPAPPPAPETILVYPDPPDPPRYYYERTIYGSTDVSPESSADRLKLFATGQGRQGRGMNKPLGIAVFGGRIFVADTVSRVVHAFDFPRQRYYRVGAEGIGRVAKPLDVAVDRIGHIYVLDATAKRVQVYDYDGNYVNTIGSEEIFTRPSGIAVNQDGSRIYVVDNGGVKTQNHAIHVFDFNGTLVKTIGTRGTEDGNFNLPLMAAVGPNGHLHVTDTGNFRIQIFDADGNFERAFGSVGRRPGQFSHPKGITVDDRGIIYVVDTAFGNFQIFNDEGRILMFIGDRSESAGGPGQFLLPAGIASDVDGRIYVVDQFYRKIDVFRPVETAEGTPLGQPVPMPPLQ
jgi:DNA-binding beta-propeller fold protein YncE